MKNTVLKAFLKRTSCLWTRLMDTQWNSTEHRTGRRASSTWSSVCVFIDSSRTASRSAVRTAALSEGTMKRSSQTVASTSCDTLYYGLLVLKSARQTSQCFLSRIREETRWKHSRRERPIGTYNTHTTRWVNKGILHLFLYQLCKMMYPQLGPEADNL